MSSIQKYKKINTQTKILEIGTGIGWFTILCNKNGIDCKGLEISADLVQYGKELGRKNGIDADISLGNIEDADIGKSVYDVIMARSVFEHVEHWRPALLKVYQALRPGGLLFFSSTNKFSFTSGEYNYPFYGWLPDSLRYRLRIKRQGEDIMKWGIDFNQFNPIQLRRYFKSIGIKQVFDRIDAVDPDKIDYPKLWKRIFIQTLKTVSPLKHFALFFAPDTRFICIK
jgi:2-polyprenyl-6-hydroxyphenyl methylase/3-demethylubiquinone-9 3-methyltransferase